MFLKSYRYNSILYLIIRILKYYYIKPVQEKYYMAYWWPFTINGLYATICIKMSWYNVRIETNINWKMWIVIESCSRFFYHKYENNLISHGYFKLLGFRNCLDMLLLKVTILISSMKHFFKRFKWFKENMKKKTYVWVSIYNQIFRPIPS